MHKAPKCPPILESWNSWRRVDLRLQVGLIPTCPLKNSSPSRWEKFCICAGSSCKRCISSTKYGSVLLATRKSFHNSNCGDEIAYKIGASVFRKSESVAEFCLPGLYKMSYSYPNSFVTHHCCFVYWFFAPGSTWGCIDHYIWWISFQTNRVAILLLPPLLPTYLLDR